MKINVKFRVMLFYLLWGLITRVDAQVVIGPFNVMVSKQNPPTAPVFSGSLPAMADEGRIADIRAFEVTGPISVTPNAFNLTGPPCPTYDATGRRTPETPAASASSTFTGSVNVVNASIPAPGNSAEASFKLKDYGYWTTCSSGLKHYFDSIVVKIAFNIQSIKLKIGPANAIVCSGGQTEINAQELYPANGGIVTWAGTTGKVSLQPQGNKCILSFVEPGDDQIIGTYTAGNAVYRDTIQVKAIKLAFKKPTFSYLCPVDAPIVFKDLLTDDSHKDNLEWTMSLNNAAYAPVAGNNPSINRNAYRGGDIVRIGVKHRDNASYCAFAEIKFYYLDLAIPVGTVCDGAELPFTFTIRPAADAATEAALLASAGNITPKSKTRVASLGNPLGSTNLQFEAVDPNFKSKVKSMIWYATQANECNITSDYEIWGEGDVNGKKLPSYSYFVTADANFNNCVNGTAYPVQYFSGIPSIRTAEDGGGWYGYVEDHLSFKKDVKCTTTNICHNNSQYRKMVDEEEKYHAGQMEGTNGNLFNNSWKAENVFAAVDGNKYYGPDQALARYNAWNAFINARNVEILNSNNTMFTLPGAGRCAMEKEAKNATNATHRAKMTCAYPGCP